MNVIEKPKKKKRRKTNEKRNHFRPVYPRALVAAAILAVFWFVKELSSVLLPFFIAWFLAYLLYPIVKFVQYKLHVPTRALSIIVTLIFVTAIIGGVTYLIIPPMIEQFDKLGSIFTRYIQQTAHTNNIGEMVRDWIAQTRSRSPHSFAAKTSRRP